MDWTRRTEPEELPEWMDEPCSLADLQACLRDLGKVNALSMGYRPTLQFFDSLRARTGSATTPLRVLDVGSGGGDMLHRIARWANRNRQPVELMGIDLNPNAARVAQQRYGSNQFTWLTGDALTYRDSADVIISSLLTHHLSTDGVVQLLRWMEATAQVGWFVNDLERSARSARLFATLSKVLRWHRFVQHDGPVSFARSFSRDDWRRMLQQASLSPDATQLVHSFPARLCVSRLK